VNQTIHMCLSKERDETAYEEFGKQARLEWLFSYGLVYSCPPCASSSSYQFDASNESDCGGGAAVCLYFSGTQRSSCGSSSTVVVRTPSEQPALRFRLLPVSCACIAIATESIPNFQARSSSHSPPHTRTYVPRRWWWWHIVIVLN
jgi:hypothetical protein